MSLPPAALIIEAGENSTAEWVVPVRTGTPYRLPRNASIDVDVVDP